MLRDKIKKYIKISGGNSGLTEEFIYNNQEFDKKNAIILMLKLMEKK